MTGAIALLLACGCACAARQNDDDAGNRFVGVGADAEIDADICAAGISGGGCHIGHSFDAIDLLFEWRDDTLQDDLCVSAGIVGGDLYGRWRNIRVLGDG